MGSNKPPLRFPSLSKVRTPSSFEAGPQQPLRSWKRETLTKIVIEQTELLTQIRAGVAESEAKVAEVLRVQWQSPNSGDSPVPKDVFEEFVKLLTAPVSDEPADGWIETVHEVFLVLDNGHDLFHQFCNIFLGVSDEDFPVFLTYLQPLPEAESIATETASAYDDVDSETRSRMSGGRSRKVTFEDLDAALETVDWNAQNSSEGVGFSVDPRDTVMERSLSIDRADQIRTRSKSPLNPSITTKRRPVRSAATALSAEQVKPKEIVILAESVSDHVHVALRDREGEIDGLLAKNKQFFTTVEKTLDAARILDFHRTLHTPRRLIGDIDWVHRLKIEAFAESPALFAAFRKMVGYDLDENHEHACEGDDSDTFDDKPAQVADLSPALLKFRKLPAARRAGVTILYPALGRALRALFQNDSRIYQSLTTVLTSSELADERWLMEIRRSTENRPGVLEFLSEIAEYESFWDESDLPKSSEPVDQVISVPAREDIEFLRACEEEYPAFFNKVARNLPPKTFDRFTKILFCSREVLSDEVWLSIIETQYLGGDFSPLATEFFAIIGATVSSNTTSRPYTSRDRVFTDQLLVDEDELRSFEGKHAEYWSAVAKKPKAVDRLKEILRGPYELANNTWYSRVADFFNDIEPNLYGMDSLFVRFCTLVGVRSVLKSEESAPVPFPSDGTEHSPLRITVSPPVFSRNYTGQVESPAILAISPAVDFKRTFSPTLDVFQGGVTTLDDLEAPRVRLPKLMSDAMFFYLMREVLGSYWQRFVREFIDRREEQNFEGQSTETIIEEVILDVGGDEGHDLVCR
ncbi:hypothetical protein HDU93_007902 [Gonapodya sp. JEL0774]|nr:hypothetical protein HDU93_007902 [Gonapodya sp. JEL0774]